MTWSSFPPRIILQGSWPGYPAERFTDTVHIILPVEPDGAADTLQHDKTEGVTLRLISDDVIPTPAAALRSALLKLHHGIRRLPAIATCSYRRLYLFSILRYILRSGLSICMSDCARHYRRHLSICIRYQIAYRAAGCGHHRVYHPAVGFYRLCCSRYGTPL